MNERQMNRLLMEKVGKKFYGHDTLKSKYDPQIPESAEREYVRTTNAYMAILKTELEEQLPKLKEAYKKERDAEVKNQRNDSATDLQLAITSIFNTIKNNVVAKTIGFGLRRKLENLAHLNRKLTVKEWKRAIKATLGIDIREDYYLGDFYEKELLKWVEENVNLIKTIPEDTLDKMRDIVYDGFTTGKTTTRIEVSVQRDGKLARFCVRDNGCGIPLEQLGSLFDGTLKSSETASGDGKRDLGLGLTVCTTIVRAHGGFIDAKNLPGGGAEFSFCLPLSEEEDE